MQGFCFYIYGSHFIVRTDHASLQWLLRENADGMTFQMLQKLQDFIYRIDHRPGWNHCNANRVSRRPTEKPECRDGEEEYLQGQITEFQTMEKALGGAQDDIKSGSSSELRKRSNSAR